MNTPKDKVPSKRSSNPPIPGSRPRHESPSRSPARKAGQAGPLLSKQDYVDHYLSEGERLLQSGVEPHLSASAYIKAYPVLLPFLRRHGDALAERGVVTAEVDAGQVLTERLLAGPGQGQGQPSADAGRGVLPAAAARLSQLRDSVRRTARGPDKAELRARWGLLYQVEPCSAASVLHGIELFLGGARGEPELLRSFRLIPQDLVDLEEHQGRLRALLTAGPAAQAQAPQAGHKRDLLAAAAYFDSLAAAISLAFPEGDPRRIAGLKLVPRHEDRRKLLDRPRLWRPNLPSIDD